MRARIGSPGKRSLALIPPLLFIAIALGAQVWMDGYIQPMIEPQNFSLFPRLSVALPVAPGAIDT